MGLDPRLEYIPEHIKDEAVKKFGKTQKAAGEALFIFNKGLIDSCFDLIPAVKPQSAYYEMYGIEGIYAMYKTIAYAKSKDLYVILDGKRGDIGESARAYSAAYLGETDIFGEGQKIFDADCLTVNPYLGYDGIGPFVENCEKYGKSIFVLVKTSNESSGDFQDITVDGEPFYEKVARKIMDWGAFGHVGAVIGATYPKQLAGLRKILTDTFFLVPGFGAQGGTAEDVKFAFDKNGESVIVNSSRAIMCAYQKQKGADKDAGENFGKWAREEVIRMKNAINDLKG